MLEEYASAEMFMQQLVRWEIVKTPLQQIEYATEVKGKCRYFAPWVVATLIEEHPSLQDKFLIHEGTVQGKHHVWVEYEDHYIDGTLVQFDASQSNMSVMPKNEAYPLYGNSDVYTLLEWFEHDEATL